MLLTRLLPGMVLYHGTPYGKKFVHPRGPAWFTPDKDVTENYLDRPWSSRAEAWAEKIEKNPRRLKFRLKKEVKLPWVGPPFGTEKEEVLASYAAPLYPHLSEEALTEAIEVLGTSSGSSWVRAPEDLDSGFYSNLFSVEGTEAAVREFGSQFKDVVDFMQMLCKKTPFEGWIQRFEDGTGTEVALCDPKGLLRPAASQVPRGPKMNRRQKIDAIRKQLQQKRDRDGYRAKMEAERLRQEAEFDKEEDLRYKVYLSITGQAEPGELDYSDPEFRRALKNWTEWVSPLMVGYNTDSWDDVTAKSWRTYRAASGLIERPSARRVAARHRVSYTVDTSLALVVFGGKRKATLVVYDADFLSGLVDQIPPTDEGEEALRDAYKASVRGMAELNAWKCGGQKALSLDRLAAGKGLGPLLSDLALSFASKYGMGVIPDRENLSAPARRVFQFYFDRRPDVTKTSIPEKCRKHRVESLDTVYSISAPIPAMSKLAQNHKRLSRRVKALDLFLLPPDRYDWEQMGEDFFDKKHAPYKTLDWATRLRVFSFTEPGSLLDRLSRMSQADLVALAERKGIEVPPLGSNSVRNIHTLATALAKSQEA